ncbi:two-component system response regulator PilR (NtrC family) [Sulfuritortus calidifontis]|uniref:Two-component system response regulator PilR (NtrC family) n=1 Tax=Sulfuritortus calidifontis TaxID=1914471 RepID=A0A4R3K0I0_9PROT|nr:sigma-54 dependent transcriptional regulator [Sulfuritortus calidifontis]TCS73981.1 two-component system response regulator PilR (NtrC family) [Sulfuritortus calidifontis]
MAAPTVLIVDDEPDLLDLVELTLVRMGLDVERAKTVAEAKARLQARHFELCLTDMRLPDGEGLEIVRHVAETSPTTPVAVITAFGSADNAVAALKAGAFDYVSKPVSLEQLRALVRTALKTPDVEPAPESTQGLVGESPAMRQVRGLVEKVARSQAPVFIHGETGTGKEVAARLIHGKSHRAGKPFVAVNCGAIPENLMESEFFGYRKGAFTGAEADRDGFFQAADGGTLFLDEVADLPMAMQVKLLRAIQEKRVRRVGGPQEETVDVRLISASHQDLARAVEAGRFRHDLFYRLNVIELKMPPLRERREDIPALVDHIMTRYGLGQAARLSEAAMAALMTYSYPGNVRELENILERAFALSEGELGPADLNLAPEPVPSGDRSGQQSLQDYLDAVERQAVLAALEQNGGNKTAAAKQLGVTFRSLRYRLERLGID